jgi:CRP-like cAMP-binding protein
MVDLSSLRDAQILKGLAESHLHEFGTIGREIEFRKGERLFSHGQLADLFYIVKDGQFALTITLRALSEPVEFAVEEKRAGDALGWSAVVEPNESIYSAYCTADGSVIAFPRVDLMKLVSSDVELCHRFLSNLAELIGSRVRFVQNLWVAEVENSMARVSYWTHTKMTSEWLSAVKPPRRHLHLRHRSSV